uniref:Uncharacterized protein LOC111107269 n=1 Tax=Crassostrea virginica TaxID=6565 RepID=A0A8B8B3U7_CRAVI|nr:uncharacterized protein LOC111107269 [Crassostrea virginica]
MKKSSLSILTVCMVLISVDHSAAQSEYNSVLQATGKIAGDINRGAFSTVVKNVAKTVSPFLNIFSSVLKLIFGTSSAPTESPELKYLHQLSDSINLKFDQVNSEFSDVKKLIDWTAVKISYATLETNIRAVSDHFKRIFEVPFSGMNEQKQLFIMNYKNGYTDSGTKLYEGFMLDNGVISQGLLRPAMKYTENNRGQMRTFMLGILKLLIMAAKAEMAYLGIKGYDHIIPFYSHQWQVRLELFQEKMNTIDLELKDNYLIQAKTDIDRFSMNNLGLSNHDFSRNIYRELSSKYFWRDWLVVVSTHTEGRNDAHSRVCNGVIKSTHRTKDLVIDSVEKDKPYFDINEVYKVCAALNHTCYTTAYFIPCAPIYSGHCSYAYGLCQPQISHTCYDYLLGSKPCRRVRRCGDYTYTKNAEAIFTWFTNIRNSCSTYSSIGIIATDKNPVYYAGPTEGNTNRLYVYDLGLCKYYAHFFG